MDLVTQNQERVFYDTPTGSRQTVENNSGYSDTEPTEGFL